MPPSLTSGQPPEPEFYVDENLGQTFVSTLRVHGDLRVHWAQEVFPRGTEDVVWIPQVANQGWVAITQDHLDAVDEQIALIQHGVKVFVLVGQVGQAALAALFLNKIKWVRRQIAASDEAFLAKIYCKGAETRVVPAGDLLSRWARRRGW